MIDFNNLDMSKLNGMMEQAKKMQEEADQRLRSMKIEGSGGGDRVRVVVNGKKEVTNIAFSPAALQDDPDMLADLTLAALNTAYRKADEQAPQGLQSMMPNVDLSAIQDMFRPK